jgi:hypothetical protein
MGGGGGESWRMAGTKVVVILYCVGQISLHLMLFPTSMLGIWEVICDVMAVVPDEGSNEGSFSASHHL